MMSKRRAEATEALALSNSSASASAVPIVPVGGGALVLEGPPSHGIATLFRAISSSPPALGVGAQIALPSPVN